MFIQKRNIGVNVLLSIVTCGIYGLYWMYTLTEDTNYITRNRDDFSGGIVVLLNIVTCGIFGVYWAYKQGEKLDRYFAERSGIGAAATENLSMLYLLLAICSYFTGFTVLVAYALMQDKLNHIIDDNNPNQGYSQYDYSQNANGQNIRQDDNYSNAGNEEFVRPTLSTSNDMIVEFKDDEE